MPKSALASQALV